ncbi:unnamed protein product [Caenorhabditis bovis]|uniref:Uncharacterized protein n=1 Tax=Caenorhabditis bovis TaxID=2654633 RepID=A0A8S1EPP0_9PELO|nr:unnamed protein product [Caenorhabditis bovis]
MFILFLLVCFASANYYQQAHYDQYNYYNRNPQYEGMRPQPLSYQAYQKSKGGSYYNPPTPFPPYVQQTVAPTPIVTTTTTTTTMEAPTSASQVHARYQPLFNGISNIVGSAHELFGF